MRAISLRAVLLRFAPGFLVVAAMVAYGSATNSTNWLLLATFLLLVISVPFMMTLGQLPGRTEYFVFEHRDDKAEAEYRRFCQGDERGYFLLLRSFNAPKLFRSPEGRYGVADFNHRLAASLNRWGGVVLIGGPHVVAKSIQAVVLRPQDDAWVKAMADAMGTAWGIFLVPELSGGVGVEMRALGGSPFWRKTVVCVPPHDATEAPARWEATVERGRSIGLELPSYDARGFVYVPRRDLSVAMAANGPQLFILGERLEHIDEIVDDLVTRLQSPPVGLKTALAGLLEYERADARAEGPAISLELMLGDLGTRLLRTACELCVQLEGRTVSFDHLRHAANVAHVSPEALKLELTALQDARVVKLPRTPYSLTVTTAGFEWFAQRYFPGYAAVRGRFVRLMKGSPKLGSIDVAKELWIPLRYADHLFEQLEAEGMVKTRISVRGEMYIKPGSSRLC